jgi:hypothetical protein
LNALLDQMNATRHMVFADVFSTFTLTPGLNPHTIGPTGTWVTAQRPVSIEGASLELSAGIFIPIALKDAAWWDAVVLPGLTSAVQMALFYNPTWPNGELWFWPVPSTALAVVLMTRVVLAQVTLATTFTLPPGYQKAITLTLAEDCAASFGTQPKPSTVALARQARAAIFNNNDPPCPLVTRDAGLPGGGGGVYNYRTGLNE